MSDDRTLVDRLYSAFSFMTEHPLIEEVRELDRDYWEAQSHINELEVRVRNKREEEKV